MKRTNLDSMACDRLIDLGLRTLAREHGSKEQHRPLVRFVGLAVAMAAVAVTISIGTLGRDGPDRWAQSPVAESWAEELAAAPVVSAEADVARLPMSTVAVRLVRATPDALVALGRLRRLAAVAVDDDGSWFSGDEATLLMRHTRLRGLELKVAAITDASTYGALMRFPALAELRLHLSQPLGDWSTLPRGLRRLAIAGGVCADTDIAEIVVSVPSLLALELQGEQRIRPAGLRRLQHLAGLRALSIHSRDHLDEDLLAAVATLPLRQLDLSRSTITTKRTLQPLRDLRRLERLSLCDVRGLSAADLDDLVALPWLRAVDMSGYGGADRGVLGGLVDANEMVTRLGSMTALREVSLRRVRGLRLDALVAAAKSGWARLDLRNTELRAPRGAPSGAGPLQLTDIRTLKKMLAVEELIL